MANAVPQPVDDAPYLEDDPATDEHAWKVWTKYLVIGVAIGIPAVTALMFAVVKAVTDLDSRDALIIAFWVALWGGVFAGGTAGAMIYAAKQGH